MQRNEAKHALCAYSRILKFCLIQTLELRLQSFRWAIVPQRIYRPTEKLCW
jgi:hypothetical protein